MPTRKDALKGQSRETYDVGFFHESNTQSSLIHSPKPFRIPLRIRVHILLSRPFSAMATAGSKHEAKIIPRCSYVYSAERFVSLS